MQELWEIRSTVSFLSLPGPLWLEVVLPDKVQFMGQMEMFDI